MKRCGNAQANAGELEVLKANYDLYEFHTGFNFLKNHMGLRRGQYHLFLGETGMGKTALIRSVLLECCIFNHCSWLSTEESHNDFKWKMSRTKSEEWHKNNITFFQEGDEYGSIEEYFARLEAFLREEQSDVLFFDNFTTSWLSRQPVPIQEKAPTLLLSLAKKLDIAIIVVAHTKKSNFQAMNDLLDADSVRGNQTLVLRAPYMYIMQTFKDDMGRWYPIIRNRKARFHEQDKIYALHFDKETECYVSDREIEYAEVLKIYQARRRLTDGYNKRRESDNSSS